MWFSILDSYKSKDQHQWKTSTHTKKRQQRQNRLNSTSSADLQNISRALFLTNLLIVGIVVDVNDVAVKVPDVGEVVVSLVKGRLTGQESRVVHYHLCVARANRDRRPGCEVINDMHVICLLPNVSTAQRLENLCRKLKTTEIKTDSVSFQVSYWQECTLSD